MKVHGSYEAYILFSQHMTNEVEEFWTLALSSSNAVLGIQQNFRGTVDQCLFHPRDVFRFACTTNASKIVVAHNHPSGELQPSPEDIQVTERLITLGLLMGIAVVDHLVLSDSSYLSLASECPRLFHTNREQRGRGQASPAEKCKPSRRLASLRGD